MAFPTAAGYGNLPLGNFSPVIFSKKAQLAFRKLSVVDAITNSDYMGEISNFGDSVRIMKEPEVSVAPYARGQQIVAQDLLDEDFTLTIDQANYFAFKLDDIEEAHSHIGWMDAASNRAAYRMKDNFDQEVLGYLSGFKQAAQHQPASVARVAGDIPGTRAIATATVSELLASNILKKGDFATITTAGSADHSIPLAARLPGATALSTATISPLTMFARMARLMDRQNVDQDGRWLVIDPVLMEILKDEDSRLMNEDFGESGGLRNGLVTKRLHGFTVYVSNNLPKIGTGPETTGTANQNTNFGVVVAGHTSAVATAEQINKTEKYRDVDSFADVVRGMQLYGRKILRPEALVTAKYNIAG